MLLLCHLLIKKSVHKLILDEYKTRLPSWKLMEIIIRRDFFFNVLNPIRKIHWFVIVCKGGLKKLRQKLLRSAYTHFVL